MRFFSFNDPSLTVSSITKQFHTNSSITTEVDHRILNVLKVFPQNAVINVFKFFQFCSCRKRRWDIASRPPARPFARPRRRQLGSAFLAIFLSSCLVDLASLHRYLAYFSFDFLFFILSSRFFSVILIFVLLFFSFGIYLFLRNISFLSFINPQLLFQVIILLLLVSIQPLILLTLQLLLLLTLVQLVLPLLLRFPMLQQLLLLLPLLLLLQYLLPHYFCCYYYKYFTYNSPDIFVSSDTCTTI